MLPDDKRKQLDEIVIKMANQNAPKEDVQLIVNDFLSKYDVPEEKKKSVLGKTLSTVGGVLKGAGSKIVEQVKGIKPALQGYGEQQAQMIQETKGNPLLMMLRLTTPIVESVGGRALDVGEAAVKTVRDVPTAFKTAGVALGQLARGDELSAPLETKYVTPEQVQRLKETTNVQRPAIEGVAEFIPDPLTQFAVGTSKGQREGIEQGYSVEEATGRGLVSGVERGLTMKALQKLFGRGTEKQKQMEERLSPKMTQKQQELAIKEGRAVVQKQSKIKELLFGKKKVKVEAPKPIKQAVKTVKEQIKNADKMDDFTLQQKLDSKVGEVANKLKPQLEKVTLDKNAIPKIKSEWQTLKNKQAADFSAVDYKLGTLQKDFEKVLNKATQKIRDVATGQFRYKNMNDVWDLAKAYDQTIPSSIKNALPDSGLAWAKRSAWIENKNLLRDFIKANSGEAKEAFSVMHDLMKISENIVEKGIPKTATPGLLRPRNLAIAAGVYGAKKFGLDRLLGIGGGGAE